MTSYCGTCGCSLGSSAHSCARGDECQECPTNDERQEIPRTKADAYAMALRLEAQGSYVLAAKYYAAAEDWEGPAQ